MWLATSGGVDEPQDPSDSGRIEVSSRPSGMSRGDLKAAFNVFKKQTNATSGDSDEAYIQLHLQDVSLLPTVSRASTAGIWVVFFQIVPAIIVRTGLQDPHRPAELVHWAPVQLEARGVR